MLRCREAHKHDLMQYLKDMQFHVGLDLRDQFDVFVGSGVGSNPIPFALVRSTLTYPSDRRIFCHDASHERMRTLADCKYHLEQVREPKTGKGVIADFSRRS